MGFWQTKRGNMSSQKWISFVGLIIGAMGFGASISELVNFTLSGVLTYGSCSTPQV